MKTLFIFDGSLQLEQLDRLGELGGEAFDLFPLTGNAVLASRVRERLEAAKATVSVLASARLVKEQAVVLRDHILDWTAALGEMSWRNKPLRRLFLLPGLQLSGWWLGCLAEKNTLKDPSYLRMAQTAAVEAVHQAGGYDRAALAVEDSALAKSLKLATASSSCMPLSARSRQGWRERASSLLRFLGPVGHLIKGLLVLGRFGWRGVRARRALPPLSRRAPQRSDVLVASYFPAIDSTALEQGRLVNRYWPKLPEDIESWGRGVSWLLMPVTLGGKKYSDSLEAASRLSRAGVRLSLAEEFFSPGDCWRGAYLFLRQAVLGLLSGKTVLRKAQGAPPLRPSMSPLLREMWLDSMVGKSSAEGVSYALLFCRAFELMPPVEDIVYPMEMHPWERCLIAAARQSEKPPRLIGFQHAAISSYYFHFFHKPSETIRTGEAHDLPLPDHMAVTGQKTEELLESCGYPLTKVEAIRNLYVRSLLDAGQADPGKALLVAGGIDPAEVRSLAAMACSAFPEASAFSILFKPHPMRPFDKTLDEMGIDPQERGYEMLGGPIADALSRAGAVLVTTSTVSIEALAFGCTVILPATPDGMLMNPLVDYPDLYRLVASAEELQREVEAVLVQGSRGDLDKARDFVRDYWLLDPDLPRWRRLLCSPREASS